MIKLEMPEGMIETTLNIKGIEVEIKKCENDFIEDEYNTCVKTKLDKDYMYVKKYLKDLKKID